MLKESCSRPATTRFGNPPDVGSVMSEPLRALKDKMSALTTWMVSVTGRRHPKNGRLWRNAYETRAQSTLSREVNGGHFDDRGVSQDF